MFQKLYNLFETKVSTTGQEAGSLVGGPAPKGWCLNVSWKWSKKLQLWKTCYKLLQAWQVSRVSSTKQFLSNAATTNGILERLTGRNHKDILECDMPDILDDVSVINHRELSFIHDGVPSYYYIFSHTYFNRKFPHRLIGRGRMIVWQWSYIK